MQPSHSNTGDSGLAARLVGILNHDFCPGANRWVYWLKHPAVPLVAAAGAALICGVMVNANALIVGLALVAVLVLGCVWPWIVVRGLRAELEFDHARGREGEPSGVRVRISNRCPWPALGLALERGFSRFGSEEKGVALARIAGWSNTEFRWEFTPDSRGEFPCEPCRLVTAFPFGLWRAARPVRVVAPLLVWPRIVPLASIPDAADLTPAEEGLSPRRVGQTGDLMGTRGFREGDSLRRVHWPQTARQGRLIVCERQAAAQSAVRVELDVTSEAHRGTGSEGSLEWTIRAGASICECLRSHHAHVECWLGGEVIAVGETHLGRVRLMDRLARVPFTGAAGSAKSVAPGRGDMLRIVCTTPVGQAARRGSVVDRQTTRWVMISSPALPADAMDAGGAVIRLRTGDGHDPAGQFSRDWERFCHAATR